MIAVDSLYRVADSDEPVGLALIVAEDAAGRRIADQFVKSLQSVGHTVDLVGLEEMIGVQGRN